jgi:hypothetical protein
MMGNVILNRVNEKLIPCGPAQANGLTAARLWCVAGRPGSTDRRIEPFDDGPTILMSMKLTAMTSKTKTVTTAVKTAD